MSDSVIFNKIIHSNKKSHISVTFNKISEKEHITIFMNIARRAECYVIDKTVYKGSSKISLQKKFVLISEEEFNKVYDEALQFITKNN